jgi:hypothetical protein
MFFKLDFKKSYKKINWEFMFSALNMEGFPEIFTNWTKAIVNNGKLCIMVNDRLGFYFQTKKGLTQGDAFSPLFLT